MFWNLITYSLIILSLLILLAEYGILGGVEGLEDLNENKYIFFDIFVASLLLTDYLLRIWASKKRLHFFFNFYNVVDLISISPSFLGLALAPDLHSVRFTHILKVAKGLRMLRFLRLIRLSRGLNPHRHHFERHK